MSLLIDLEAAMADNLQHPAMAGADPLTDSLLAQLDTCATEGAQPALPYAASTTAPREHPGWWLAAGTALAALGAGCFFPWGA